MALCDVTLREADQMPGRSYGVAEKVEAGTELDRLGVDYLQAGFPITGETDREVIRRLSGSTDAEIVSLARALQRDVDAALEAGTDVVEVMIGVSDRQLTHVMGSSRAEALAAAQDCVDRARDGGASAHLTVVDAFRTDHDHLQQVFESVEGVDVVTLADTVGARTPTEVQSFLGALREEVSLEGVGVHFHDDLGVATANALVADELGVGKLDVSVASLGERAGNPALEEVVVAKTLREAAPAGLDPGEVIPACRAVLDALGEEVSPRKAVLGSEPVTHESGLHTAVMLDDPSVFEPFDPERFGGRRRLVFGEATGASAAEKLLARAGAEASEENVDALLALLAERGPLELEAAVSLAEREFS